MTKSETMSSETEAAKSESNTPPTLHDPDSYGIFRSEFSASEQRELLHEDTYAQTRVCLILTALIAIGMCLAILSVMLVAFFQL